LKKYHPSRVLTLVYQPFAIGTMAILAYNEAKINTRKRNIAGYILFTASTLMLMVVSNMNNSYLLWFNLFPINFNS
jgi:equilibrative nucleoside transporter 1/2/3